MVFSAFFPAFYFLFSYYIPFSQDFFFFHLVKQKQNVWGTYANGKSLAVVRLLVSECSVPELGVWVGLGVAFLWVLGSFSFGVALRSRSCWDMGRCSVCLGSLLFDLFWILRADGAY